MLFNSTGYVINSSVEGALQMKSYLKGNPDLNLSFNDDLVIGNKGSNYSSTKQGYTIDDCNFHQNVDISNFDSTKSIKIKPPEGNYTHTHTPKYLNNLL